MATRFRTMGRQIAVALSSMVAWVAGGPAVPAAAEPAAASEVADPSSAARNAMVTRQIEGRGLRTPAVLRALRAVPRHEFVPSVVRTRAYQDTPLPIGEKQTISQPYIVALMTELAAPRTGARVLEIGTGSGYQAAVLAELGAEVHTIEIIEPLGRRAAETLQRLGYTTVKTRIGDGYRGWPQAAPFEAILVTAAPPRIPEPLKQQLAVGGRLVVPVGVGHDEQDLLVLTRTKHGFDERRVIPVRFVPMTGEAQQPEPPKPQPSLPGRQ